MTSAHDVAERPSAHDRIKYLICRRLDRRSKCVSRDRCKPSELREARWRHVALALFAIGLMATSSAAAAQPNFVLILVDDMTPTMLRHMPQTRALVRDRGTLFNRALPNINICAPSRATLLTGRYAHNTGIVKNMNAATLFRSQESSTLAVALRAGGYRTGLFGKYMNGHVDAAHRPAGWDRWFALVGDSMARVNPVFSDDGAAVQATGHTTEHLLTEAEAFVEDNDPRPFFVFFSPPEPHMPHIVPRRHQSAFARELAPHTPAFNEPDVSDKPRHLRFPLLTAAMIGQVNENWRGALRSTMIVEEAVERLSDVLPPDTIIVFLSDNGYFYGEHRIPKEKFHLFDAGLRVTLMFAGPGILAGQVRSELVGNADLAPTLLQLAGLPVPSHMDGRSLAPLLRGESPSWRHSLPLARHYPTPVAYGLRSRGHTFVRYGTGETELYESGPGTYQLLNRNNDPAYADRKAQLAAHASALKSCSAQTCRSLEDTPVP